MSNESVTDEIILAGFTSLKETMEHGFDALEARLSKRIRDLEHRVMRRFDQIDDRLDGHERRITTLETQR